MGCRVVVGVLGCCAWGGHGLLQGLLGFLWFGYGSVWVRGLVLFVDYTFAGYFYLCGVCNCH